MEMDLQNEQHSDRLNPIAVEGAELPNVLVLIPRGPDIVGVDGRRWRSTAPDVLVQAFNSIAKPLPIDIEHATELKGPKGEPAPAVGWIKKLAVIDGAVAATEFDLTPQGREYLTTKAYRYLSPAIRFRASDREITQISSVALTNKPNLDLPALNHSGSIDRVALCRAIGADAETDDDALMTRLATLRQLERDVAAGSFVPKAEHDVALNRAVSAETALSERDRAAGEAAIQASVDASVRDGKFPPAAKDRALAVCRQVGVEQFEALCAAMPVIGGSPMALNRITPGEGAVHDGSKTILEQARRLQADAAKDGKSMAIDDAVVRVTGGITPTA